MGYEDSTGLDLEPVLLTDESPAEPVAERPRRRRHRALYWGAAAIAAAATAAGATLAVTTYQDQTAPERVVLDYLAAVARGDAATALAYGDLPERGRELLTPEVLGAQLEIAPIRNATVDVQQGTGDTATAQVTYELVFADGPQTVEDEIPLTRDGRTWRLTSAAAPVTIAVQNAPNHASVAGAEVPDGPQLAFPGALPVTFDTENLTLGHFARVVRFAEPGDIAEDAELSEAGEAAVEKSIDAALTACLTGTAAAPTRCPPPPDGRGVPGTLRGTLVQPTASYTRIAMQPGNDGLVRVSGTLSLTGEYDRLDYNNQRAPMTGHFVVDLLVVCFASTPDALIWRQA